MTLQQKERALKVGWHLGLVVLALYEMSKSETPLRRAFTGACAGWHVGCAYDDYQSE